MYDSLYCCCCWFFNGCWKLEKLTRKHINTQFTYRNYNVQYVCSAHVHWVDGNETLTTKRNLTYFYKKSIKHGDWWVDSIQVIRVCHYAAKNQITHSTCISITATVQVHRVKSRQHETQLWETCFESMCECAWTIEKDQCDYGIVDLLG